MDVGKRIEGLRVERGLSQSRLAAMVQERFPYVRLSQQNISQMEQGDVERSGYLVEIAIVLGVSPVWLATGEGPRITEYLGRDRTIADTIKLMEHMSEYTREQTVRIIRELARDRDSGAADQS